MPPSTSRQVSLCAAAVAAWLGIGARLTQAQQRTLTHLIVLSGACSSLVVKSQQIAGVCKDKVLNTVWSDGREGFIFASGTGSLLITFSGDGRHEIHQGPNGVTMPVDVIFMGFRSRDGVQTTQTIPSVGTCYFQNPYSGPVPVNCQAATSEGKFEAKFITNGSPPSLIK